jgi:hypothetical protein
MPAPYHLPWTPTFVPMPVILISPEFSHRAVLEATVVEKPYIFTRLRVARYIWSGIATLTCVQRPPGHVDAQTLLIPGAGRGNGPCPAIAIHESVRHRSSTARRRTGQDHLVHALVGSLQEDQSTTRSSRSKFPSCNKSAQVMIRPSCCGTGSKVDVKLECRLPRLAQPIVLYETRKNHIKGICLHRSCSVLILSLVAPKKWAWQGCCCCSGGPWAS